MTQTDAKCGLATPLLTEEEREWLERAEKLVEQARTLIAELEDEDE